MISPVIITVFVVGPFVLIGILLYLLVVIR